MTVSRKLALRLDVERVALKAPVRISGFVFTETRVLVVTIDDGERSGRGEACGVYYLKEDAETMTRQIEALRERIEAGIDRHELQTLMPRGGARNAIDCALWDFEAKRSGRPVHELAGMGPPHPLLTTYSLGADEPEKMAAAARVFSGARALKLKLTGEPVDAQRVRAVRAARPDVWMGVDGNQGFSMDTLERLMPVLLEAKIALIEQPLPVSEDAAMEDLNSPIPLAADESIQDLEDLPALLGRFDIANIKLDKCGGLTAGLAMAARAKALGLKPMVGCMAGTSLAMAPAFILGQLCDFVDLDAPLALATDRHPGVAYEEGRILCPAEVWG